MVISQPKEITQLLVDWTGGNKAALDHLMPLVYKELRRLASFDARKSQVVELRFFGGLSIDETSEVMKISSMTVQREWRWAKAYLHRELTRSRESDTDDTGSLAENH